MRWSTQIAFRARDTEQRNLDNELSALQLKITDFTPTVNREVQKLLQAIKEAEAKVCLAGDHGFWQAQRVIWDSVQNLCSPRLSDRSVCFKTFVVTSAAGLLPKQEEERSKERATAVALGGQQSRCWRGLNPRGCNHSSFWSDKSVMFLYVFLRFSDL